MEPIHCGNHFELSIVDHTHTRQPFYQKEHQKFFNCVWTELILTFTLNKNGDLASIKGCNMPEKPG